MTKILIAAHGTLAENLKTTVSMIVGKETASEIETLCMTPDKDQDILAEEALEIISMHPNVQYCVLTDLYGASPSNACLYAFRNSEYRLITGVNLSMIIEVLMCKDMMTLEELSEHIQKSGKDGIRGLYLRA